KEPPCQRALARVIGGRHIAAHPHALLLRGGDLVVYYTFSRFALGSNRRNEPLMTDQIVITEKTSQEKDIRAAVGSRYGDILPAEGHLFDLLEPEDVVPAWKRWSPILLRPKGLYGTRPAEGGDKAA